MNQLQTTHTFECPASLFEKARVTILTIDDKLWFIGTEIARMLGYSNPQDAVKRHCNMERGYVKHAVPTSSGIQEMTIISEANFYRLVGRSKLSEAVKFNDWVVEEVLPSIRKTGTYTLSTAPEQQTKVSDKRQTKYFGKNLPILAKVPDGYFTVGTELMLLHYMKFFSLGHIVPDYSQNGITNRIDISVSSRFGTFLKNNFPDAQQDYILIPIEVDETSSYRQETVKAYRNRLLPLFRHYFTSIWMRDVAPTYLKERDDKALDMLQKRLGDNRHHSVNQIGN